MHLEAAKSNPEIEIVACCDVSEERRQKAVETYGGRAYEKFVDLYDQEEPDAVVICTPPFAHGDIEEEAAKRGIHFLVEKPVAVNMEMAKRVLAAVNQYGVTTQVGYLFRFSEAIRQVKEMLSTRAIAMVQAHYYMPGLPGAAWWHKMELSGGQLIEQTTHSIDLGRFLAGDAKSVVGFASTVHDWVPKEGTETRQESGLLSAKEGLDIPDTAGLLIQYESGAMGTVSCSIVPGTAWDVGVKIVAQGLIVTVQGPNASWAGSETGEAKASEKYSSIELYEFVEAVNTGSGKTSVPYIEGVKSLAISVAGIESSKRGGTPVEIAELLEGV
jgi:predicted dehydrogenase